MKRARTQVASRSASWSKRVRDTALAGRIAGLLHWRGERLGE